MGPEPASRSCPSVEVLSRWCWVMITTGLLADVPTESMGNLSHPLHVAFPYGCSSATCLSPVVWLKCPSRFHPTAPTRRITVHISPYVQGFPTHIIHIVRTPVLSPVGTSPACLLSYPTLHDSVQFPPSVCRANPASL